MASIPHDNHSLGGLSSTSPSSVVDHTAPASSIEERPAMYSPSADIPTTWLSSGMSSQWLTLERNAKFVPDSGSYWVPATTAPLADTTMPLPLWKTTSGLSSLVQRN